MRAWTISTFRKMIVYEKPGDRFMVLMSAGNLSISQSVREILQVEKLPNGDDEPITIWNAKSMFDATRVLGAAVRRVYEQDGPALKAAGIDFNCSMIFGGQIGTRPCACSWSIRPATSSRPPARPASSRSARASTASPSWTACSPHTPLDEAAKCALVSMDSTLKSNLSVGLPLDLLVYEAGQLRSDRIAVLDEHNPTSR
jgi:putative proteasome-type protease